MTGWPAPWSWYATSTAWSSSTPACAVASAILDPLAALGVAPDDVTDVVLSHHDSDHTVGIALFGEVPVHDFQATYQHDVWISRDDDTFDLTPPCACHDAWAHPQDLTVLVGGADGDIAPTHLLVDRRRPGALSVCPRSATCLREQCRRGRSAADLIVPGHGPASTLLPSTPL